ncbi:endonuclease/exonuclease/phosphatase family protein [Demequina flava]|uniref:endonuclease/exonuclease/phosphatase family protein n=1 Tax=Demequina flava TaxID=1095025 RepID=UPI00078470D3|nr:hypothetical protein [Demequina flava]
MTAARRSLGLIAIATWLLIDSLRTAGPLLLDLAEPTPAPAYLAIAATLVGGALLAWVASLASEFFSHGGTVWFLVSLTAVFRIGLPFLDGAWMIGAGLYVTALAIASVILAARVAMGNGAGPTLMAGTALGAAAAVIEQTMLRTLDAVWRDDIWGWVAIGVVALLAIANGWRCHDLEPAAHTRGWWAYGLFWGLMVYAFANVGYVASQADLRLSFAVALAVVGLLLGARLAASSGAMPGGINIALVTLGAAAIAVMALVPGTAAAVALPAATAISTFAVALVMRTAEGTALRSLGASMAFVALLGLPLLAAEVDRLADLPLRHGLLITTIGLVLMAGASMAAWNPVKPPTAPGVLPRIAVGVLIVAGASWWTHDHYEQERTFSQNFLPTPAVMAWNLHHGVTPSGEAGPGVNAQHVAATLTDNPVDVAMLQEVERGGIAGGGIDMVEYLSGELNLPYLYAGAQTPQSGNAIFTSRPFSDPRSIDLDSADGPDRGAVSLSFMGATYVSTQIGPDDTDLTARARDWLGSVGPTVIGGDRGDTAPGLDATTVSVLLDSGFTLPSAGLPGDGLAATALESEDVRVDFLLGREVELNDFTVLDVLWSDHRPLIASAVTGLTGTISPEAAEESGVDADTTSPEPSADPSASATPADSGASESPNPEASPEDG